ncbi:hypothetical protein Pmani_027443 [Petrolisthes manimaculis]|uniref:Uncharacterized protein n=1 Tax=Petrolisthes manimaculis TaxID=1843537 RepID=A0AAE1TVR8_9EUCA|nr:hypothetical protein Pmani_027443 [Petrolisthes manimaculis]
MLRGERDKKRSSKVGWMLREEEDKGKMGVKKRVKRKRRRTLLEINVRATRITNEEAGRDGEEEGWRGGGMERRREGGRREGRRSETGGGLG